MKRHVPSRTTISTLAICTILATGCIAAEPQVPLYGVHEIELEQKNGRYGKDDSPARDVELATQWRHESGEPTYTVHGFWDGNGDGAPSGNVFKVRFCPTRTGRWTLIKTTSNVSGLNGLREGYTVTCVDSARAGLWIVDDEQAGGRWYKRSDGSHPYILGNTMYSFLSEYDNRGPSGGNIADDIRNNARYFKKVRLSITGDRYPHPNVKPFLDDAGKPTDDGNFSHRPNPAWFRNRVDLAVETAYERDLIVDLILCGPDTRDSRSTLQAAKNDGDPTPLLRYIAARYGSYPNVWICLCNEFDIKKPKYTTKQIARFGRTMRRFLPYPTPMSIHAKPRDWYAELNTVPPWHDHVIIQKKLKKLPEAADWVARSHAIGGNVPVIDDELAYEGAGDGWSEADVIESHLGAFLGGGYGTTGHKPAGKQGHYFWGHFKASEHHAADNLAWLRQIIDKNITFWRMVPTSDPDAGDTTIGRFANVRPEFRVMEWPGREYVLGTNRAHSAIKVHLPTGTWRVTSYDVLRKKETLITADASGRFTFDAPGSRAVLFHFVRK